MVEVWNIRKGLTPFVLRGAGRKIKKISYMIGFLRKIIEKSYQPNGLNLFQFNRDPDTQKHGMDV